MRLKWLGHSAFLITSQAGTKIITDPYERGAYGALEYGKIQESADVVTVSHAHADHDYAAGVLGQPEVVNEPGLKEVKGVIFKGLPCYHDASSGKIRGANIIFCFTVDGINVCHMGDLGHELTDKQFELIGKVDLLLVPVGGNVTIDARAAAQLCDKMKPRVVVPMHYRTSKCALPLAPVNDFLNYRTKVTVLGTSEVELKASDLPEEQTLLLEYAL